MKKSEKLHLVYTGTEVSVLIIKKRLLEMGVEALIKNEYQSGIIAGFTGGVPSAIDLYIKESDVSTAKPVIEEFIRNV